jgi:hypothetical protein
VNLKEPFVHQFSAELKMLRNAIELCPESLWHEGSPNRFWHLAYHALFYTHFYLSASESEFVPWTKSRPDYNFLHSVPSRPNEPHRPNNP